MVDIFLKICKICNKQGYYSPNAMIGTDQDWYPCKITVNNKELQCDICKNCYEFLFPEVIRTW